MKARLPLSLLFACAVSAASAFAAEASDSASTAAPTSPTQVLNDKLLSKQWQWYTSKNGVNIVPLWNAGLTGSGNSVAYRGFVKSSGLTTTPVVIGIVDEWVEPNHEDLNVLPYYNADTNPTGLSRDFALTEAIPVDNPETKEDESKTQIYTEENHGTFVAGMAAATGNNELGVAGAAPGAAIAGLHISLASLQEILDACYWGSGVSATGMLYTGEAAIQVKNCSFGSNFDQDGDKDFWKAISETSANNVIYVFAAGNARGEDANGLPGSTGWDSTGSCADLINVGATNKDGRYTSFSNFGSNLFVTAPGQAVVSTDRSGTLGYNTTTTLSSDSSSSDESTVTVIKDNDYASSDGTSFSSPLVAGVVALGKEVCPVMDVRWAKHAIAYSSGHGDAPNIDCVYDKDLKTYVQASGYTSTTTDEESGEEVSKTVVSTGNWQKNNGGYWFNNNYGFGMIDPEGFVEKVRNIAYSTVETRYSAGSDIRLSESSNLSGAAPVTEYSVGTFRVDSEGNKVSVFDQKLETVSVTVAFSKEAVTSNLLDLCSLKVTLVAPDGKESVLVQQSSEDPEVPLSSVVGQAETFSYTFLTNAFWGSSYSDAKDWTVRVEYAGARDSDGAYADTSNWISVSGVDFTMGTTVDESVGGILAGKTVNAHALSLDVANFSINGNLNVEDAVYVNGGNLVIADGASVDYYTKAELNKNGAVFVQNGGTTKIAGSAKFNRGVYLYAGKMLLAGGELSAGASGLVVDGGALEVSPKEKSASRSVAPVDVSLRSGSVSLSGSVEFLAKISQSGGKFSVSDGVKAGSLAMSGGVAEFGRAEFTGALQVGSKNVFNVKNEETGLDEEVTEYKGGVLNIAGKLNARSGLVVAGEGLVQVADGIVLSTAQNNTNNNKTAGIRVSDKAAFLLGKNSSVVGNLNVSGGSVGFSGGNEVYGIAVTGGVFSATETLKTATLSVRDSGTFDVAGEVVLLPHSTYTVANDGTQAVSGPKMTVGDGATLSFSARQHGVSDMLVIGIGQKLVFEEDASVKVAYDFGNTLPFETKLIELTKEFEVLSSTGTGGEPEVKAVQKLFGFDTATITAEVPNAPQYWDDTLTLKQLSFEVGQDLYGDVVLRSGLTATGEVSAHRLYYSYQTELQTAVQKAILKNEAVSGALVRELNVVSEVSTLLTAYDKIGVASNVVAIDELHDKQANAITGAVSRRSRELRSGFIHYDVWSNPLLGSSGFSFSARPNLVAAKGFVPYMLEEADYPLMVWANGGYSFSEADDGAMSVTSTKSNMLNVALGADYSINENLAAGVFIGYTSGRTKFDDGGRTEIQSRNIGVYLTGSRTDDLGSYYGTALASFGFEEYDFSRKFSLGSQNSSATASPEGWQGILFLEGGYEWKMEKFSMGPVASVRYVSNNIDGYTESSSDAWMRQEVDDVNYDSLQTSLGWRFAYRADFETVSLLPEARISWNHEFLGTDEDFDAKLAMAGADAYTCTIADTGDDYMSVGVGLTMMLGEVSTISLDYDMQFLRDDADPVHSVNAMFRTRF